MSFGDDGLKDSSLVTAKPKKRSKKRIDSDSDSDEVADVTSERSANKKKKFNKDEQLEKIVNELT